MGHSCCGLITHRIKLVEWLHTKLNFFFCMWIQKNQMQIPLLDCRSFSTSTGLFQLIPECRSLALVPELCQNVFKTDMTAVNLLNLQESACNCHFLFHLSFCQLNLFKMKSEGEEDVDWLGGFMAEEGNSHQPLTDWTSSTVGNVCLITAAHTSWLWCFTSSVYCYECSYIVCGIAFSQLFRGL